MHCLKLITFGWNLEPTRSRNPNRINDGDDDDDDDDDGDDDDDDDDDYDDDNEDCACYHSKNN